MRKPVGIATAAVMISGIAVSEGWPHAVAAVVLVVTAVRLSELGKRVQGMRETLDLQPASSLARGAAHLLVLLAAARFGTQAALDLAAEDLSVIESMARGRTSGPRVLVNAAWLALKLGSQEPIRARSQSLQAGMPSKHGDAGLAKRRAEARAERRFMVGSLLISFVILMFVGVRWARGELFGHDPHIAMAEAMLLTVGALCLLAGVASLIAEIRALRLWSDGEGPGVTGV